MLKHVDVEGGVEGDVGDQLQRLLTHNSLLNEWWWWWEHDWWWGGGLGTWRGRGAGADEPFRIVSKAIPLTFDWTHMTEPFWFNNDKIVETILFFWQGGDDLILRWLDQAEKHWDRSPKPWSWWWLGCFNENITTEIMTRRKRRTVFKKDENFAEEEVEQKEQKGWC